MTDKERIAEHIYETYVRRRGWEHWNQMSEVEKATSIKRFADPIFNILGRTPLTDLENELADKEYAKLYRKARIKTQREIDLCLETRTQVAEEVKSVKPEPDYLKMSHEANMRYGIEKRDIEPQDKPLDTLKNHIRLSKARLQKVQQHHRKEMEELIKTLRGHSEEFGSDEVFGFVIRGMLNQIESKYLGGSKDE